MTKIKKIYQALPTTASVLNQESESQTDTYSCDLINSLVDNGKGIIEIHEETNAMTLSSGIYSVASDSTGSLYVPIAEGGTPSVGNCWEVSYEGSGKTIVIVSNLFMDEDYTPIDSYDAETIVYQDSTIVVCGPVRKKRSGSKYDYKEFQISYFKSDSDYSKDYCIETSLIDGITLPDYLPIRTFDTVRAVPSTVFRKYINILTKQQTFTLKKSFSDTGVEVVFPRGTLFIGLYNDLISSSIPCLILSPNGERYIVTYGNGASWGGYKLEDGNKITISGEEPVAANDGDLWIDSDGIDALESEVVNSLEGNETTKAPSVKAVNDLQTYSTDEQVIGTWIDGKPIYRKVITTTSSDTNVNIDLSSLNIDSIFINFSKSFFKQGAYVLPLGIYGSTTDWNRCFYATNTLTIQFGSVYTMSKNIYVTIEYTKTTD